MRIHTDLSSLTVVRASVQAWVPSPAPGVERRRIYRVGGEVARATSIVRYAPGSAFPAHTHTGGEEFLVLEGTFQDQAGDYPAGSYVRNPPGSSHAPAASEGATIFVRLWQFRAEDTQQVVRLPGQGQPAPLRPGAQHATLLFEDAHERVQLERWAPGAELNVQDPRGIELLLVRGSLKAEGQILRPQDWVRVPGAQALRLTAGPAGAQVWMKLGPLQHPSAPPLPGT